MVPQTNSSLFLALCTHSCALETNFLVGYSSSDRLTMKFFANELLEKKEFLIDMSSLSFLLSMDVTSAKLATIAIQTEVGEMLVDLQEEYGSGENTSISPLFISQGETQATASTNRHVSHFLRGFPLREIWA